MNIRIGYEIVYECPQPTFMILLLNVHYSRVADLMRPDFITTSPPIPLQGYRDAFANWCTRLMVPAGVTRIAADTVIRDNGAPDAVVPSARQAPIELLPDESLVYLLGSRYCETDLLMATAWSLFGHTPAGWARCRPYAITCTTGSSSATGMHGRTKPPMRRMKNDRACAAISRILL